MAALEVRLFGALRVGRPDRRAERLPGKRINDLLAYLLLTRATAHSRDHLAGLFWGDQEESRARHCLNTALWRLRQALGTADDDHHALLLADSRSIGFNPASDVRIDVAEFEDRISLAEQIADVSPVQQATLLHEAIAIYTADLLLDCYDDWCLLERERLQRMYLRSLQILVRYHTSRGEHEMAIDLGRRLLARDPLREDVHRDLMHLYLLNHQPAAALQQFRGCEAILRSELGIAPMPETQVYLSRIVATWSGPTPRTTAYEPPRLDDVIVALRSAAAGLDQAMAQVQSALSLAERLAGAARAPDEPVDRIQPVFPAALESGLVD